MQRLCFPVALLAVLLTLAGFLVTALGQEARYIGEGERFPETPIQLPEDRGDRSYLGLDEGETFTLSDIEADLVFVEILNVHCLTCQRQTLSYNLLYDLVEEDPETRGRIKFVAFASGNVDWEVEDFRDEYDVSFPVLPDPRFELHRAIGGSPTPFAIFVRQDPIGGPGIVAGAHIGAVGSYQEMFEEMKRLMRSAPAELRPKEGGAVSVMVEPILSEDGIRTVVEGAFASLGGPASGMRRVELPSGRRVFTALVGEKGDRRRVFAEMTSRPSVCEICHDIHFLYVFDQSGRILRFVPLHLTKYQNRNWNDADIAAMRERIVGRSISRPFNFRPKVDAVSSATITSSIIFDSLSQGEALLAELREQGLL